MKHAHISDHEHNGLTQATERIVRQAVGTWIIKDRRLPLAPPRKVLPALAATSATFDGLTVPQWVVHWARGQGRKPGHLYQLENMGAKVLLHPGIADALFASTEREMRVSILGELGPEVLQHSGAVKFLLTLLNDSDERIRLLAVMAIGELGVGAIEKPQLADALLTLLTPSNDLDDIAIRTSTVEAIVRLGDGVIEMPQLVKPLLAMLNDPYGEVRESIIVATVELADAGLRFFRKGDTEFSVLRTRDLASGKRPV